MKIELFNRFSESPVYLEENAHVYVHKITGEIYNSVTTALSLIKEKFDKDGIISNIIKQYNTFISWYRKNGGSDENLIEILRLYILYNKLRPFEAKTIKGQDYKFFKKLQQYNNIEELYLELLLLSKTHKVENKALYLKEDYSIMDAEEISALWDTTNLLSRHYGHMIHESVETYLLESQGFSVDKDKKIKSIVEKYNALQDILYKHKSNPINKQFFSVYDLNLTPFEFMDWIVLKFRKANPDLGYVVVPEKVNFSPTYKICGTADVEIVLDEKNFKIGDHKTNKRFSVVNQYGNYLKPPFSNLQETEFNLYSLQINCYGLIQEVDYGRTFHGGWITYFDRQAEEFQLIQIPIMLTEAEKLLNLFNNFQTENKEKYLISGIFNGIDSKYHNVLTKYMYEDIEKRKKDGNIDMSNKKENKQHYVKFLSEHVSNLQKYIV